MQRYIFEHLGIEGDRDPDNLMPSTDRTLCHNEVCTIGLKYLKAAGPVLLMQAGKVMAAVRRNFFMSFLSENRQMRVL